jgi:hypothetical protein
MTHIVHANIWSENLKAKYYLEDQGLDGRMSLKWNIKKQGRRVRTGFFWFRIRKSVVCCEYGIELLNF